MTGWASITPKFHNPARWGQPKCHWLLGTGCWALARRAEGRGSCLEPVPDVQPLPGVSLEP